MPIYLRRSGVLKEANRTFMRRVGVLRQVRSLRMMVGGTLRTIENFTTPLTPTASPTSASGTARSNGGGARAVTNAVSAAPNGGTGPYTYRWAIAAGVPMSIANASMAQTTFALAETPGVYEAVARCTITDAFGQTGIVNVSVTITITGFGGGPIE